MAENVDVRQSSMGVPYCRAKPHLMQKKLPLFTPGKWKSYSCEHDVRLRLRSPSNSGIVLSFRFRQKAVGFVKGSNSKILPLITVYTGQFAGV